MRTPYKEKNICWWLGASFTNLNNLPYLLSISVSMAVIKDFSTIYMKALGLNQAYMLLKLHNNYFTAIKKVFIFFFIWITRMIFYIDTENNMDTENDFENNDILRILINILDDVWIYCPQSNSLSINKKHHIDIK